MRAGCQKPGGSQLAVYVQWVVGPELAVAYLMCWSSAVVCRVSYIELHIEQPPKKHTHKLSAQAEGQAENSKHHQTSVTSETLW
jgi:hypothetical protein